jgi:hypothetical protein
MFCSKKLVVAAGIVALCVFWLGVSTANAAWMTPTAIYDHSLQDSSETASKWIDGNTTNLGKLLDDSPPADLTDFIVTGYAVFDLGSVQKVEGWKFWSRNHTANLGPKDVDFFHWNNEVVNAHGFTPNTSDQIALDANVVIAANRLLPGVNSNSSLEVAFAPGEQFEARYVGLRINTGYDTPANAAIHMAEVQFNTTVISPEPSGIILLVTGLIGLVCYAWRRRRCVPS